MDLDTPYALTTGHVASFRRDGFIKLRKVLTPETLTQFGREITRLTLALNTQDKPLEERSTYDKAFRIGCTYDHSFGLSQIKCKLRW